MLAGLVNDMAKSRIKIKSSKNFKKTLGKGAEVDKAAKRIVRTAGTEMQQKAQRLSPVDTGALKRSIGIEMFNSGLTAVVSPTMDYSAYLEFGTRFMSARPYMRPAFRAVSPKFKKAMKEITR